MVRSWRFVVALVAAVSVVLQGFVPANAVAPVPVGFYDDLYRGDQEAHY